MVKIFNVTGPVRGLCIAHVYDNNVLIYEIFKGFI